MIHKIAIKITDCLIYNGVTDQEKEEQYTYGIEVAVEKLITYTILLFLALYLKLLIPSILFVVFFVTMRVRTGGFHANTYFCCFICTIVMYLSCTQVIAPFLINERDYMFLTLIITSILIFLLAPINHPNLNMDSVEIKRCKREARFALLIELEFIIVATCFGINIVYIVYPIMGMMMCAILLVIAKIIQQEVSEDEKQLS